MSNLSVSDVIAVHGAVVSDAIKAEKRYDKAPERIKLSLVVRKWAGKLEVLFGIDDKVAIKKPLNVKLDVDTFRKLRSYGLRKGSRCDLELAVGGWSTDRDSGSWYEFLGLIRVDDRDINYFVYQDDENTSSSVLDGLSSTGSFDWDSGNGYGQEGVVEEVA